MCALLHAEIFARQGKVVSVDRMAPSERHENPALATTVVTARRSAARPGGPHGDGYMITPYLQSVKLGSGCSGVHKVQNL